MGSQSIFWGQSVEQLTDASGHTSTGAKQATELLAPSIWGSWAFLGGCLSARLSGMGTQHLVRLVGMWLLADVSLGCVIKCWGARGVRPATSAGGVTALSAAALALVLSSLLGQDVLAVTAGGLLLSALIVIASAHRLERANSWLVALHVMQSWWLGSLALIPWRSLSVGLGLVAAVGTWARLELTLAQDDVACRWLLSGCWLILVVLPLLYQQPILAAMVAVAAVVDVCSFLLAGSARRSRQPMAHIAWLLGTLASGLGSGFVG